MKKFVALFGAPGVGKSTLIKLARWRKIKAYDLETGGNTYCERLAHAKQLFKNLNHGLFNAADLHLKDFPKHTISVLLMPSKYVYLERRLNRNSKYSNKSHQHGVQVHANFKKHKSQFTYTLDNKGTVTQALNKLISMPDVKEVLT